LFAGNGGSATNPNWFENLRANPSAQVELADQTVDVFASVASGQEREELRRLILEDQTFGRHRRELDERTDRVIPVVVLERRT
jgi:deazaflavin-dependent oxidoreductase (nitroreductase family)